MDPSPGSLLLCDQGNSPFLSLYLPIHAVSIIIAAAAAKSLQSCPTLCDPIDGSPLGSRPWDSPGRTLECPLEEDMATHSNILAWRIPWTEKPDRLQSITGLSCVLVTI